MKIPSFRQETLYTCGAAVCRMILSYYEIDKTEVELVKELNITPEKGVTLNKIKELFGNFGFNNDYYSRIGSAERDLERLEDYLEKDVPVIVQVNRFEYDKVTERMDIKTKWEGKEFSHHFIIPTRICDFYVYFNDPHEKIGRGKIPKKQFLRAWYTERLTGKMLAVRR